MLLKYKCRRCGEIQSDYGGNKEVFIKEFLKIIVNQWSAISVNMIHHCKDGGLGISDIIGADPEDNNSK